MPGDMSDCARLQRHFLDEVLRCWRLLLKAKRHLSSESDFYSTCYELHQECCESTQNLLFTGRRHVQGTATHSFQTPILNA